MAASSLKLLAREKTAAPSTTATAPAIRTAQWQRPRKCQFEPAGQTFRIVVLHTAEELAQHVTAWDELAGTALEPNVFYESWMLLPALKAFGADQDLRFVLLYTEEPAGPARQPILCGFFPLERQPSYKGFPVACTRLWRYKYAMLCTPLIHADYARDCLAALLDWLKQERDGGALLALNQISGDGLLALLLTDYLDDSACPAALEESYARALFERDTDSESFLTTALSNQRRKYLRKQERRLERLGQVEYVEWHADTEIETWLEEFLQLEAKGWKGRASSALASDAASQQFFLEAMREGARRERLLFLALRLNGNPIALKCCLRAGAGSFAFKIAFDEDYEQASPGWQLELETIHRLHCDETIEWMDSCAAAHSFTNQLWPARRTISTWLLSTGKGCGDLAVALLPLSRWLKRKFYKTVST